jgi:hypothetical protein
MKAMIEQIGERLTHDNRVAVGDQLVYMGEDDYYDHKEVVTVDCYSDTCIHGVLKTLFTRFDEWPTVPIESVEQAKKYAESEEWSLVVQCRSRGFGLSVYDNDWTDTECFHVGDGYYYAIRADSPEARAILDA